MKFLIVVQDLRISGTSEGIVSRSFISKLRAVFSEAIIDVVYLKHSENDDRLDLLPVNNITSIQINRKVPILIRWAHKFYWRFLHISLIEKYLEKTYRKLLKEIKYETYDHIFIRSSGLEYETILGAKNLPMLKKAIINFHDPYPVFWNMGVDLPLSKLELFRLKKMHDVIQQAKLCISPSHCLSNDIQYLYKSNKKFKTLPHQYSKNAFDFSNVNTIRKKQKKVSISYHGVIQFAQNIDIFLDAYVRVLERHSRYRTLTEVVMRIRGSHTKRLKEKYKHDENIHILETLDFVHSAKEQIEEASIMIVLEICATRSNILVGKAPFLASLKKPILVLSPEKSELRNLIVDDQFIASYTDGTEVEKKLEKLIENQLKSNEPVAPFGTYFEEENFKAMLKEVIK